MNAERARPCQILGHVVRADRTAVGESTASVLVDLLGLGTQVQSGLYAPQVSLAMDNQDQAPTPSILNYYSFSTRRSRSKNHHFSHIKMWV